MPTYWSGNKKVSKTTYDSNRKKAESFTGPQIVDASTPRQASGKQPVASTPRQASGKQPVAGTLGGLPVIPDVRKNLEDYLGSPEGIAEAEKAKRLFSGSSEKQPDTSALNAIDQDTLRRLQEAADRKRMEEQFEATASHGKEIVFEFSKPISSKANTYVSKLVKMLGGKRSYIENQTKLVVVM